ncbi:MAG: glycosyl transferase family 2, partial [Luteibaculum sp.]
FISFADADLATPLSEIVRLSTFLRDSPEVQMAFGIRLLKIGSQIERKNTRHYGGRVIATLISMALRLPIYDTQCGAKVFRNSEYLDFILNKPFTSRWLFDVEIFFRTIKFAGGRKAAMNILHEEPLLQWTEMGDSKVTLMDILKVPYEILKINRQY